MKKILLLLTLAITLGACHKKEYPTFHYSQPYSQAYPEAADEASSIGLQTKDRQPERALDIASASTSNHLSAVVAAIGSPEDQDNFQPEGPAVATASPSSSIKKRFVVRKIQKGISKEQSPTGTMAAKAKPDLAALLSLILGGAGLIVLLLGSGLGFLLGLAGLILGIVGLRRIARDKAPTSSRLLAILGTIFSGVVILLGILLVAVIASFGFV